MKAAMAEDKAKHNILPISSWELCKLQGKGTMRVIQVVYMRLALIVSVEEFRSHP